MPEKYTTLQRIDMCLNFLDRLTDVQGRAKCGYIYILDDFLNAIKNDVLILEEKLKDKEVAQNETNQNSIENPE